MFRHLAIFYILVIYIAAAVLLSENKLIIWRNDERLVLIAMCMYFLWLVHTLRVLFLCNRYNIILFLKRTQLNSKHLTSPRTQLAKYDIIYTYPLLYVRVYVLTKFQVLYTYLSKSFLGTNINIKYYLASYFIPLQQYCIIILYFV